MVTSLFIFFIPLTQSFCYINNKLATLIYTVMARSYFSKQVSWTAAAFKKILTWF